MTEFEAWMLALESFGIFATILLAIGLAFVSRRQTAHDAQLSEIKSLGVKLNDSRLDVIASDLADMNIRLSKGDEAFEKIGDGNHSLELNHVKAINELSRWVETHSISKEDFRRHEDADEKKLGEIRTGMNDVNRSIASLTTALGLKAAKHVNA